MEEKGMECFEGLEKGRIKKGRNSKQRRGNGKIREGSKSHKKKRGEGENKL